MRFLVVLAIILCVAGISLLIKQEFNFYTNRTMHMGHLELGRILFIVGLFILGWRLL